MPYSSDSESILVWDTFIKKLNAGITEYLSNNSFEYKEEGDEKFIQASFFNQEKNFLFYAYPEKHQNSFLRFFGTETVIQLNLNPKEKESLRKIICSGNYHDEIFTSDRFPALLCALLNDLEVCNMQIIQYFNAIYFWQIIEQFGAEQVQAFKVLDDNGEYSNAAQQHLLPFLKNTITIERYTESELNKLKILIQNLPESEQFIFISNADCFGDKSLARALANRDTLYLDSKANSITHLSFGIHHAVSIARYGIEQCVISAPRIGKQSIDAIDLAGRVGLRLAQLYDFNQGDSFLAPLKVHEYEKVTYFELLAHDFYHARVLSSIPFKCHLALQRMIDVCRDVFKMKWSGLLWLLTDRDLRIIYGSEFGNSSKVLSSADNYISRIFFKLLSSTSELLVYENHPKLTTIILFIDMLKHPEIWQELDIHVENFSSVLQEKYLLIFEHIKEAFEYIKEQAPDFIRTTEPKLLIVLVMFYIYLNKLFPDRQSPLVDYVLQVFQVAENKFIDKILFMKSYKNNVCSNYTSNTIELILDGVPLKKLEIDLIISSNLIDLNRPFRTSASKQANNVQSIIDSIPYHKKNFINTLNLFLTIFFCIEHNIKNTNEKKDLYETFKNTYLTQLFIPEKTSASSLFFNPSPVVSESPQKSTAQEYRSPRLG